MLRDRTALAALATGALVLVAGCDSSAPLPCCSPPNPVPQLLVAGLSALEIPPATAASIALSATPALVDGDRATSAGLNIGFARSVAGDVAPRDVGAQLPNAVTPVSEVYVWVDRSLPADVAGAFSWAAYRSDDNLTWTPVPFAGPVTFGAFDDRFELRIERTQARYLKAVARPLTAGTTLDPRFADILVTEIELYLSTFAAP